MHRCQRCGLIWDDARACDNELTCTRRCGGTLELVPPLGLHDLKGLNLKQLPYPVALTAQRLGQALETSGDVLKTLFILKDCFEATIKQISTALLAAYRFSAESTPERTQALLKSMVRPSLGTWVNDIVRPLSLWLANEKESPGKLFSSLFANSSLKPGGKSDESSLLQSCKDFVSYRNDALGHGAQRSDATYDQDLQRWLPVLRQLLNSLADCSDWRLCLVTAEDRSQDWMGPQPGPATEPGQFALEEVGHFVLRGPGGRSHDLFPFVCYLPDRSQEQRLHFYDSLYRYRSTKKEATVLEYDTGERQPRPEPIQGLEQRFTADLLANAFEWQRGRMAVIEGRVANFGELIEAHAAIVGRRFVVDRVRRFLSDSDRGLMVIEAQPGKGKTALVAHLIDEVFGHHAPAPVHFFYRRTAGITELAVCVRSLYHALLASHGITESEESKQKNSPEEVATKLTNLLSKEISPRLLPGRPQLIFIDALDESSGNAFMAIPDNLPSGVYVIATTRPVANRSTLARRDHVVWFDLDSPDHLPDNLQDGFDYVQRELVGSKLSNDTLDEIARIGAGNFLVLKLLCQHVCLAPHPAQVSSFVQGLATNSGEDQLGFIYAEFWNRITDRCTRADMNLLCDVAGLLVTARAPLTDDMVCQILGLRVGDWEFVLRHLAEYLAMLEVDEDGVREIFCRVYHETFADFLRTRLNTDRRRFENVLAGYCARWEEHEGYGRNFALRFAFATLVEAGRESDAATLLRNPAYLEARLALPDRGWDVDQPSWLQDQFMRSQRPGFFPWVIGGLAYNHPVWLEYQYALNHFSSFTATDSLRSFFHALPALSGSPPSRLDFISYHSGIGSKLEHVLYITDQVVATQVFREVAQDKGVQRAFLQLIEAQAGGIGVNPDDVNSYKVVGQIGLYLTACGNEGQVEFLERVVAVLNERAMYDGGYTLSERNRCRPWQLSFYDQTVWEICGVLETSVAAALQKARKVRFRQSSKGLFRIEVSGEPTVWHEAEIATPLREALTHSPMAEVEMGIGFDGRLPLTVIQVWVDDPPAALSIIRSVLTRADVSPESLLELRTKTTYSA